MKACILTLLLTALVAGALKPELSETDFVTFDEPGATVQKIPQAKPEPIVDPNEVDSLSILSNPESKAESGVAGSRDNLLNPDIDEEPLEENHVENEDHEHKENHHGHEDKHQDYKIKKEHHKEALKRIHSEHKTKVKSRNYDLKGKIHSHSTKELHNHNIKGRFNNLKGRLHTHDIKGRIHSFRDGHHNHIKEIFSKHKHHKEDKESYDYAKEDHFDDEYDDHNSKECNKFEHKHGHTEGDSHCQDTPSHDDSIERPRSAVSNIHYIIEERKTKIPL